jgi:hypothetical protein
MDMKIKAVEGRMLLDPRSIGGQHRRYGYERRVEGDKFVLGKKEPRVRYVFVGGEFVVTEQRDGYFRRAILDGDADYVAHVGADGKLHREPALVAATARNVAARAKAAEAALMHGADADAAHDLALEAAERGEDL